MPFKTLLFICILLNGCTTLNSGKLPDHIRATYGSGLFQLHVNQFDKNDRLFFHNSKFYTSNYGATAFKKEVINVQIPSIDVPKSVYLYSPQYGGPRSYCDYQKHDPNLEVFRIFLEWEAQPNKIRESTTTQINTRLAKLKCKNSSVPKSKPDWYVEIEQYDKTPILVSNAQWTFVPPNFLTHRTVALTKQDVSTLLDQINAYFKD